jgi:hypothetical protein
MAAQRDGGDMSQPSEGAARAAFREERDRIVLSNPGLGIAFSAADGTILSLLDRQTQAQLVDSEEAAAEGFLWRLEVVTEDGKTASLTSRDAVSFTYSLGRHRHEGNLRLWLHWRGLHIGSAQADAALTIQVVFPAAAPSALFEAEVELPAHLSVRSLAFPCLCAARCSDPAADESLFLPISGGVSIREPRAPAGRGAEAVWRATYPGTASLQLLGYCCGARTTAWLASRDPTGAQKSLVAMRSSTSGRLDLWIAHRPVQQPGGQWSAGYPTALGIASGDWFEAAREYRSWAVAQPWCARGRGGERRLPALTSSYGLWASHWGGPRHAVAAARELQRLVNIPLKLDWRCWHGCARSGAYPDYLPPRDGDEAFASARAGLTDAGVLVQLDFNGLLASSESQGWQEEAAEQYALAPLSESPAPPALKGVKPPLAAMCPATQYWQGKLAALAREALQRGADGLYVEDLTAWDPLPCGSADHEHAAPPPVQWTEGVRSLLAAVRSAAGPDCHLAGDGPSEAYLDLLDAFLSHHAAAEREGLVPDEIADQWSAIPLFSSVYHDYSILVGPGVSLVNHRPYDPLWTRAAIASLRGPERVMSRDYQAQFCLEVGRASAWGQHALLENFAPEQARTEGSRRKLAFLAAALRAHAWGVGALLPFAEFMGPLAMASDEADIEMLVNPRDGDESDRRTVMRSVQPVLGSAWRTPGRGLALVLINTHQEPREFATSLRSSRLSVQLPIRPVGRTFSEDGDVPAPRLGASGSEVNGRLPGRSITLLSLR